MKKRIMLLVAVGVCFTSVCFADEAGSWGSNPGTGQHVANSQYGVASTACAPLDQDNSSSQGSTVHTQAGKSAKSAQAAD